MPRFSIQHITRYSYEEPVNDSANQILLSPVRDAYQDLLRHRLVISGDPLVETYTDYYGNKLGSFMHIEPHSELRIDSTVEVLTRARELPADNAPAAEQWEWLQAHRHAVEFIDFLKQESFLALPEVMKIADDGFYHTVSVFEAARQLNEYVYRNFSYRKGVTRVETTLDEVWGLKAGVCQDFAHFFLVMLRILGIPARYVSGYICPKDAGMRGEGATHAWVEAYIPFYGWLGLDPTNNCVANEFHVRLAVGRNFSDCSPVKGTYKGTARQTLEVGVTVSYEGQAPVAEHPVRLSPQPIQQQTVPENNSYRRHLEMMMQQQQQ